METKIYNREIGVCESKDEYEELVRRHGELYVGWREHIEPLIQRNGLNAQKVAQGCGISLNCARRFLRAIPAKRESVIMLALMMGLSVDEANDLLTRWAKFQKLYPKYPKDFIWIYLLEKGKSDRPAELFDAYYDRYSELREEYFQNANPTAPDGPGNPMETTAAHALIDRSVSESDSTHGKESDLTAAEIAAQDARFAMLTEQLLPSFETGYQKLMDYIESFFRDIDRVDNALMGLEELNRKSGHGRNTPNQVFEGKWLDLYYRKIRELKHERKAPSRAFLIALGLRLFMNTDQLNELLEKAGMAPLCPKDRLEGTILFYLEELYCNFPTYFHPASLEVGAEYQNQMDYSTTHKPDGNLPEYIRLDDDEYPAEDLSKYITRRLEETNIFDSQDWESVQKFLELLRDG